MKMWQKYCAGLAAVAGLAPSAWAQLFPGVPSPTPPLPAAAAAGLPGAPAAPQSTLCGFLGLSPDQKASIHNLMCKTQFGLLLNNTIQPFKALSGGLIPDLCPGMPNAQELADKGPVGAAAKIKKDEAEAKARRLAVRYLGTVSCHYWPEAEKALIAALREDRNECVRWEAAMALQSGCCCTKDIIKRLAITVSGSTEDDNPAELSERVKAAAEAALYHCLDCYQEVVAAPPSATKPVEKPVEKPAEKLPVPAAMNSNGGVPLTPYYTRLQSQSMAEVVESARRSLTMTAKVLPTQASPPVRDNSLAGIWSNAMNGSATSKGAVVKASAGPMTSEGNSVAMATVSPSPSSLEPPIVKSGPWIWQKKTLEPSVSKSQPVTVQAKDLGPSAGAAQPAMVKVNNKEPSAVALAPAMGQATSAGPFATFPTPATGTVKKAESFASSSPTAMSPVKTPDPFASYPAPITVQGKTTEVAPVKQAGMVQAKDSGFQVARQQPAMEPIKGQESSSNRNSPTVVRVKNGVMEVIPVETKAAPPPPPEPEQRPTSLFGLLKARHQARSENTTIVETAVTSPSSKDQMIGKPINPPASVKPSMDRPTVATPAPSPAVMGQPATLNLGSGTSAPTPLPVDRPSLLGPGAKAPTSTPVLMERPTALNFGTAAPMPSASQANRVPAANYNSVVQTSHTYTTGAATPTPAPATAPGQGTYRSPIMASAPVPATAFHSTAAAPAPGQTAGQPSAMGLMLILHDSPEPPRRQWAVEKLATVTWPVEGEVVRALLDAARRDSAPAVRAQCIRCLSQRRVNQQPVINAMKELRKDSNPQVSREANDALIRLGANQSVSAIPVAPSSTNVLPGRTN